MGEFHSNKIIPVCAFVVGQLVVGGSCKQSGLREPRDVCGKGGWPRQGAWGVRRAHTCLFSVRSLPGTFERLLCARCSQGLGQPQAHSSQSGVDRHGDHRDTAGNSEFVLENYFVLHLKKQMRASPVRAQFAGPWLRPRGQPAWRTLSGRSSFSAPHFLSLSVGFLSLRSRFCFVHVSFTFSTSLFL